MRTVPSDGPERYHVLVRIPVRVDGCIQHVWKPVRPTKGAPYEFPYSEAQSYCKIHQNESRRSEPGFKMELIK